MARDELFEPFLEYLMSKDINVVKNFKDKYVLTNNIDESLMANQLMLINEFQNKAMGYKGYMGKRLNNKTGSIVEQYKVYIKRLKRYLKNIKMNTPENDFEEMLLKVGNEYIKRAEYCISEIFNSGYMDIIKRSMDRTEICIGDADFSNLRKTDKLEIINIDKCNYNNIEIDCFNILSKYKRKGIKLDFKYLVDDFCKYSNLSKESNRFILALLSYPYEFMKCFNRYREKTKELSEEEYENKLKKAIIKDGEVLF